MRYTREGGLRFLSLNAQMKNSNRTVDKRTRLSITRTVISVENDDNPSHFARVSSYSYNYSNFKLIYETTKCNHTKREVLWNKKFSYELRSCTLTTIIIPNNNNSLTYLSIFRYCDTSKEYRISKVRRVALPMTRLKI